MSNFTFLEQEWSEIFASARKAEKYALQDPVACCFYARRALEAAQRASLTHLDTLFATLQHRAFPREL